MITLDTERLRLRMFRDADLEAYAAMSADPEVMRYLGATGQPLTRQEAWRQMAMFLGHWQLRGYGVWAMEDKLRWPEGAPLAAMHGYGHYHDRYEMADGRWRIKSTTLTRLRVDFEPGAATRG